MKVVGNDKDTSFWTDHWVMGCLFCERFRRLFSMSNVNQISTTNMVTTREGNVVCNYGWRRELFEWENELV